MLFGILLWPFLEIYLLVLMARHFGLGETLLYCLGCALVGWVLLQVYGRTIWVAVARELARGQLPNDALIRGLMGLVGALLLILPGVINTALGILLTVPFTRPLLYWGARSLLRQQIQSGRMIVVSSPPEREVGEVIDIKKLPE